MVFVLLISSRKFAGFLLYNLFADALHEVLSYEEPNAGRGFSILSNDWFKREILPVSSFPTKPGSCLCVMCHLCLSGTTTS